jgi:hypothetical protein
MYAAHRIATFPVRMVEVNGKVEKKPAIRNYLRIGLRGSAELAKSERFEDATGLGFSPGSRSGVTILDVDTSNEKALADALDRHGKTGVIARTASGKFHAWYKHNGERRQIRPWPDRPIDILGGGFVVAPPSTANGAEYQFIEGTLDDIGSLSVMRGVDSLLEPKSALVLPDDVLETPKAKIREGHRDNSLWTACMMRAKQVQTFDELLTFSRAYNEDRMDPALPDTVAVEKAYSAWKYEQLGLNAFGGRAIIIIPDRVGALSPDAVWLYGKMQRQHWDHAWFAVPKNYAAPVLSWRRQYNAIGELIEARAIRRLSRGGRFEGDAATYAWVKKGEKGGWTSE